MSQQLEILIETIIVETLLSDPTLSKTAQSGLASSLIDKVKSYVSTKIDSNNKVESVIDLLTPGILFALGFPVLSFIAKLAQMIFHVDFGKIFGDIAATVRGLISSNKQTTSAQVDAAVSKAVNSSSGSEPTEDDVKRFLKSSSYQKISLREAQLFKVALQDFIANNPDFNLNSPNFNIKTAQRFLPSLLSSFTGTKVRTVNILITIISWIVKTILATAGFMVAEDAINKVVGNPNSFDNTYQKGKTPETSSNIPASLPASKQTTFKINPSYTEERLNLNDRWIEPSPLSNLDDTIIQWTKYIYPDTQSLSDQDIISTNSFSKLTEVIKEYNNTNTSNITFMPRVFTSRKKVVDMFIDELASKHKIAPKPFNPNSDERMPALEA